MDIYEQNDLMQLLTKSMIARQKLIILNTPSTKHKGQLAFNVCNLNHVSYYQIKLIYYAAMSLYNIATIGMTWAFINRSKQWQGVKRLSKIA